MKLAELVQHEMQVPMEQIMLLRHTNESVALLRQMGATIEEYNAIQPNGSIYDFLDPTKPAIAILVVIVNDHVYGVYNVEGIEAEGTNYTLASEAYRAFDRARNKAERVSRKFQLLPLPSDTIGLRIRGWERRGRMPVQRYGDKFFNDVEITATDELVLKSRENIPKARRHDVTIAEPQGMKGQVFTVAKLSYVNGVVYKTAKTSPTTIEALAVAYPETTKSGKAKHPQKRVRDLARLAEGIGLLALDKHRVAITDLGKKYYAARSREKWVISEEQQEILRAYILENPYRTETIFAITSLLMLLKAGYEGNELSKQYAIEIGKSNAWKSDITYHGFTSFGINYIEELGFKDVEKGIFLDVTSEVQYQEEVNAVNPISLPEGQLPPPKPIFIGKGKKYLSNPRISKAAIVAAEFLCELDPRHLTFTNALSGKQHMEAHHLVPMGKQGEFDVRLDVPENILSLCPTCHRKIHLADNAERKATLEKAFLLKKKGLPSRGIVIDLDQLWRLYGFC